MNKLELLMGVIGSQSDQELGISLKVGVAMGWTCIC